MLTFSLHQKQNKFNSKTCIAKLVNHFFVGLDELNFISILVDLRTQILIYIVSFLSNPVVVLGYSPK